MAEELQRQRLPREHGRMLRESRRGLSDTWIKEFDTLNHENTGCK
jgi:hypothetical protein